MWLKLSAHSISTEVARRAFVFILYRMRFFPSRKDSGRPLGPATRSLPCGRNWHYIQVHQVESHILLETSVASINRLRYPPVNRCDFAR